MSEHCTLGMGCDDVGVCYAVANGQPEMCGRVTVRPGLKIAIDYDKTFTADPAFWTAFIAMAISAGHAPFIVTARSPTRDKNDQLRGLESNLPVYYCDGVAKRWWCLHWGPGKVDIWIDDNPDNIIENSAMPFDDLQTWRAECAANEPGHCGPKPFNHL